MGNREADFRVKNKITYVLVVFLALTMLNGVSAQLSCDPEGPVCTSDCGLPSSYLTYNVGWVGSLDDGGTCKYNNMTEIVWFTMWNNDACANGTVGYDVYPAWVGASTNCYEISHVVDGTYYDAVCPSKEIVGHNVGTTDCGCSINNTLTEYPCTNNTFNWGAFDFTDSFFYGGDPDGTPCIGGGSCFSSLCVDGVCCDTVCNSECMRCSGPPTWLGSNGTCGAINAGSDPDSECDAVYCDEGANPPYYYGWDGLECYYAINVSAEDNVCDGAGMCGSASTVCVSESNEVAATAACQDAIIGGCNNIYVPMYDDELCSTTTTISTTTTTFPPAPCVGSLQNNPMGCSGITPQSACEQVYVQVLGSYYQCWYPGGCTVSPPHPCYVTTTTLQNSGTGTANWVGITLSLGLSVVVLIIAISILLLAMRSDNPQIILQMIFVVAMLVITAYVVIYVLSAIGII